MQAACFPMSADIVEKVLFPGWQKNLSVTVRQFKYLAGGTANCSASPCMTLQTAPTGKAASILTLIGISRRMWPTYFSTFSTVSAHGSRKRTWVAARNVVGVRISRMGRQNSLYRRREILCKIDAIKNCLRRRRPCPVRYPIR